MAAKHKPAPSMEHVEKRDNPCRLLALAVIQRALLDYINGPEGNGCGIQTMYDVYSAKECIEGDWLLGWIDMAGLDARRVMPQLRALAADRDGTRARLRYMRAASFRNARASDVR